MKIVVVTPTNRPDYARSFYRAWSSLFNHHSVAWYVVHDGDDPYVEVVRNGGANRGVSRSSLGKNADLVCRRTDAVRNLGFYAAARARPDVVITLDDDVRPPAERDPIAEHLDALFIDRESCFSNRFACLGSFVGPLGRCVPASWMNAAGDVGVSRPYLRGFPHNARTAAPVAVSHGVWDGVPDFDGETQLRLEETTGVPTTLPYYRGPVPRGVLMPVCGMNLAVRGDFLEHLYFAPMGPDSGVSNLHRFADIWMGINLKRTVDAAGAAMVTGFATVRHERASDARKNRDAEALGREWNEYAADLAAGAVRAGTPPEFAAYWDDYDEKRRRWAELIRTEWGNGK